MASDSTAACAPSLSDTELDDAIEAARRIRDEYQARVDDLQRFADSLVSIRVERRFAARKAKAAAADE